MIKIRPKNLQKTKDDIQNIYDFYKHLQQLNGDPKNRFAQTLLVQPFQIVLSFSENGYVGYKTTYRHNLTVHNLKDIDITQLDTLTKAFKWVNHTQLILDIHDSAQNQQKLFFGENTNDFMELIPKQNYQIQNELGFKSPFEVHFNFVTHELSSPQASLDQIKDFITNSPEAYCELINEVLLEPILNTRWTTKTLNLSKSLKQHLDDMYQNIQNSIDDGVLKKIMDDTIHTKTHQTYLYASSYGQQHCVRSPYYSDYIEVILQGFKKDYSKRKPLFDKMHISDKYLSDIPHPLMVRVNRPESEYNPTLQNGLYTELYTTNQYEKPKSKIYEQEILNGLLLDPLLKSTTIKSRVKININLDTRYNIQNQTQTPVPLNATFYEKDEAVIITDDQNNLYATLYCIVQSDDNTEHFTEDDIHNFLEQTLNQTIKLTCNHI